MTVLFDTKYDDVIKWKHFPRFWPFVSGFHRSPVNFHPKVTRSLNVSLICVWTNNWVNNRDASDLRRNRAHHDVTVIFKMNPISTLYLCRHMSIIRHFYFPMLLSWSKHTIHLFLRIYIGCRHISSLCSQEPLIGQNMVQFFDDECHPCTHYDDVIMDAIAFQITSLRIVYSIVYSGTDQRKHQNSASLAFGRVIHRGPVNSPHKGPVTRKVFPFDDVITIHLIAAFVGSSVME